MDFLLDALTNWLKEMLVGGIMGNLTGMFDSVNQQVADIATQRERLAAPLYEHLASLRKALADAQSEQKDASESHRRTLEELKRDLARVAEMTQAAHKEAQDHGV